MGQSGTPLVCEQAERQLTETVQRWCDSELGETNAFGRMVPAGQVLPIQSLGKKLPRALGESRARPAENKADAGAGRAAAVSLVPAGRCRSRTAIGRRVRQEAAAERSGAHGSSRRPSRPGVPEAHAGDRSNAGRRRRGDERGRGRGEREGEGEGGIQGVAKDVAKQEDENPEVGDSGRGLRPLQVRSAAPVCRAAAVPRDQRPRHQRFATSEVREQF